MPEAIGIIAGESPLPLLSCREAHRQGLRVVVAAVKGLAPPELLQEADEWAEFPLGRLGGVIRYLRRHGVCRALMIGRVRHASIFSLWAADAKLLRFLARVGDRTTTSLLAALADFFAGEGIEIIDSTHFLKDHLVEARNYTPRLRLAKALAADIEFAWEKSWGIAGLDIGQTVCVKGRAVVAVEAMEGTDEVIRRAAAIAGPGLVVAKVSRPGHDMRFDVPVTGPGTMAVLEVCRAAAFVMEAGRTLMLDADAMAARAGRCRIVLMGKA
ncbi:MAG: UDP-2,3-diacylglucosamine diphosphatase LpxI [Candidatus Aminicenantes bacterium]|nr:UDP-2,3-diacylglucosamine diphosphatase LpxI [Candidatus Aminicenantes bacterium]